MRNEKLMTFKSGVLLLSIIAMMLPVSLSAQKKTEEKKCDIIGQVKNFLTHEPIDGVKLTFMTKDSTVIGSSLTEKGVSSLDMKCTYSFTTNARMPDMIVKVQKDGYETKYVNLPAKTVKSRTTGSRFLDPFFLKRVSKAINLDEVKVRATKVKFYNKGDTLIYNADAFQLANGSMLDGLIRQLPGVELKDNGQIYVNGKYVESLLLNGEDFFSKDRQIMLDNLPAYMVQNVKVYDKASFRGEMMKKKLGDEKYVMDVHLKKDYNVGWIANAEAGGGTHDRWLARLFASRFTTHSRVSVFSNMNNLNDIRRPGDNTSWTPDKMPAGEKTQRQVGLDYNIKEKDNVYKLSGNVTVLHNDEHDLTRQNTINYLTGQNSWMRYQNASRSHEWNINTDNDWRWRINRQNFMELFPSFNYRKWKNTSGIISATFNEDPSVYVSDAVSLLDSISQPQAGSLLRRLAANRYLNRQMERGHELKTSAHYLLDHYFNEQMNTELLLQGKVDYDEKQSNLFSQYRLDYPSVPSSVADYRNRYEHNQPDRNLKYELSGLYTYYLDDNQYLQGVYMLDVTSQHHDYSLYRLDQLAGYGSSDNTPLGTLPSMAEYEQTIDLQNSFYRRQTDVSHLWRVSYNISRWHCDNKDISLVAGVRFQLSHSSMDYRQASYDGCYHHHTFFTVPYFRLRKMWDKYQKDVVFNYTLTSEAPDLVRFIDVKNDADPLNITLGNPGLKNAHTHQFELRYDGNKHSKERTFAVWFNAWLYENALVMGYTYDRTTGVRTFRPYNINGNRLFEAGVDFSTPLDKARHLTFETRTHGSVNRSVDLMSVVDNNDLSVMPEHSIVTNSWATENMTLSYQLPKLTMGLNGYFQYDYATSHRSGFENQHVWDFHYGPTLKADLPWNMQVSTDLSVYSRRGYSDNSANTNDVVWNARLSKSIPKCNLTFMLDGFDLLHQLSNISVSMNAQGRTETYRNVLPSYVLFHVFYRFNKKPKKR